MSGKLEHVVPCKSVCAEAPMLREEVGRIYWVDTQDEFCYSMELDTLQYKKYSMTGKYQSLGIREGGWVGQTCTEINFLDFDMNIVQKIAKVFDDDDVLSFNDGTVGPDGCYYMGYFDHDVLTNKSGGIYRLNTDLGLEKVLEGYALPNGLAFSTDNTKFYLTEMYDSKIWEFDFDVDTGVFSNKKVLVDVPLEGKGVMPDGMIIDGEGYLWSAQWQGFKIIRYTPDGSIDLEVPVPTPTPTSMTFLPNNKLFITTATLGCSEEQLTEYPFAGDCFTYNINIPMAKENVFRG